MAAAGHATWLLGSWWLTVRARAAAHSDHDTLGSYADDASEPIGTPNSCHSDEVCVYDNLTLSPAFCFLHVPNTHVPKFNVPNLHVHQAMPQASWRGGTQPLPAAPGPSAAGWLSADELN